MSWMNIDARAPLHHTAGGVVLDGQGRVLLVQHRNHGRWMQPGGGIEPHEDPAAAAVREVAEETGIIAEPLGTPSFTHPSGGRGVAVPFAIVERLSRDRRIGPHRCLSFIYVCRPVGGALRPQLTEVADARWVPIAEITEIGEVPDDLEDLVRAAARWAETQRAAE